jgi:hypothetical protein
LGNEVAAFAEQFDLPGNEIFWKKWRRWIKKGRKGDGFFTLRKQFMIKIRIEN